MRARANRHVRRLRTAIKRTLRRCCGDSGVTSTEYMLIMVFVVLPIAAMVPKFLSMLNIYGSRMTGLMGLPFP